MNVPNCLSVFRIILIPAFAWTYLTAQDQNMYVISALILILSGITDVLDGIIARKYHQITDLGKILDPLADKLTQATVCLVLWVRIPQLWPMFVLFILKEILIMIGSFRILKKDKRLEGSKWFGKLYTVVFYIAMILIIMLPDLSVNIIFVLLLVVAAFMLLSLFMYISVFNKKMKK